MIGRTKSDAESLVLFKDHIPTCPNYGVKGHHSGTKQGSGGLLALAVLVGIAALGAAVIGLNPASIKFLSNLVKEASTKPGTPAPGGDPK